MASVNNQPQGTPAPQSFFKKIKSTVTGSANKILSLPDKHPKLRIVFDIILIALPIIAMVAMLLTGGVATPMFFAIVPLIGFAGLGVALLISDTVKNKKVQKVAEKVAAAIVPLIVLGSGIAFITAGVLAVPTSAAFLGTPQFILGVLISSLAIVALNKITIPKLFPSKASKTSQSTTTHTLVKKPEDNAAAIQATAIINQRRNAQINQERKQLQQKKFIKRRPVKYSAVKNIATKNNNSN